MAESAKLKNEVPLESSIPDGGASLESILCTEELHRRPSRPPDYKKENSALVALVSALADSPRTILQTLAETILEITQSDSAGLSLLTKDDGGKRFYWPAIAGIWNPHVGGGTPRNFGPCGDVLDRNCTLLFHHFERRYPYLLPVIPAAEECLLVPFYVGGKAVGTIWAIMHSDLRKFDAEDDRVMGSLGKFASSAYQALESIDDLKFQVVVREKAETELRELSDGLETQVRVRTEELQLLLNLTNRITSNLEFRELLRAIAANIREVMHCDAVAISLSEPATEQSRLYALDFPDSKGFIREEQIITTTGLAKRALETLKPVIVNGADPDGIPPEIYDKALAEGLKSRCLIPLVNRGRALGFLVISRTSENSFTSEDEDVHFLTQASGQIAVAIENALAYQQISELKDKLAQEKLYLEDEIRVEMNFAQIIGNSPALRKVLKRVETVAPTDSTVLIYGETGTGKELVARAIHDLSPRRSKAFVKLNCAAIPTGLLESELFGHEKGAFTGAIAQRIGRFEVANGGTIFLDEIGEIPLELQTKLLRVLQEREFERLGSSRTLRTDARLIAATNRDLEAMVSEQKFRSDLFFRLNVFPVQVPPLREREGDIPLLVRHFSQHFSKRMNKTIETIPSATVDALCRYHWPGNIRELQNVIERAVIISTGPALNVDVADLKFSKASLPEERAAASNSKTNGALRDVLEETERQQILQALKQCNWVVAGPKGAAKRLGMKQSTLRLRMHKLGISRRSA